MRDQVKVSSILSLNIVEHLHLMRKEEGRAWLGGCFLGKLRQHLFAWTKLEISSYSMNFVKFYTLIITSLIITFCIFKQIRLLVFFKQTYYDTIMSIWIYFTFIRTKLKASLSPKKMFVFEDLQGANITPVGIMLYSSGCAFLTCMQR